MKTLIIVVSILGLIIGFGTGEYFNLHKDYYNYIRSEVSSDTVTNTISYVNTCKKGEKIGWADGNKKIFVYVECQDFKIATGTEAWMK